MTPLPHDLAVSKFIAWLKQYGLEAHLSMKGDLRICKRRPRRSRLTGELR